MAESSRTDTEKSEPSAIRYLVGLSLVAFVALCVRVPVAIWWQSSLGGPDEIRFGDSDGYLVLADRLANGESYQYGWKHASVFRAPGYPLLLAPLVKMTSDARPVLQARLLNALIGALTVAGVGWLGWRLRHPRIGLFAAALITFYPGAIASSVMVLAEAPFGLAMVLSLAGLIGCWRSQEKVHWGDALLFGILSGIATLIRPSWLLFVPAICLLGSIRMRNRSSWGTWSLALLSFVIVLLPWMARNQRVVGKPVPTTLQTGASLYDGLHPGATGASDMSFVASQRIQYLQDVRVQASLEPFVYEQVMIDETGEPTDAYWPLVMLNVQQIEQHQSEWNFEVGFDGYLRDKSVAWMRGHLQEVFGLAAIKFARIWNPVPNQEDLGSSIARLAIATSFLVVAGLALLGFARTKLASDVWLIALAPAIYFTMLHLVFVASIRYRQPAMLTIAIVAAVGVDWCWRFIRERRNRA